MSSALKRKQVPTDATKRPPPGKQVKVRAADDDGQSQPSWRFSTADKDGPFKWPTDDAATVSKILAKLRQFDTMKWSEIPSKDHHPIPIENLSKKAQDRLRERQQDDIEEVFSFRCSSKERIIGIRDRDLVKLLWWDPNHEVCLSQKKHT